MPKCATPAIVDLDAENRRHRAQCNWPQLVTALPPSLMSIFRSPNFNTATMMAAFALPYLTAPQVTRAGLRISPSDA